MAQVIIFPDAAQLALAAAERFIKIAEEAIQARGVFLVTLSGGSTPQMLYQLLASEPFSERVDWSRAHLFWGDERCVPPDHPDSNYLKAKTILLDHVPVPPANIHRIPTEKRPEIAAEEYEGTLLEFFSSQASGEEKNNARFDLVLLGMGDDGHTASLFPGTPGINEQVRWVVAQYIDKLAAWRVSLTPAILNQARHVIFLVSGAGKKETLQRVVYGSYQPERYPAQVITLQGEEPLWMVDEAAASLF